MARTLSLTWTVASLPPISERLRRRGRASASPVRFQALRLAAAETGGRNSAPATKGGRERIDGSVSRAFGDLFQFRRRRAQHRARAPQAELCQMIHGTALVVPVAKPPQVLLA